MKEEWKPVKGFEDYAEISNLGQIHRFERVIYFGRGHKSKRIQEESWTYGCENNEGYLYATIGGVYKGVHVWVYMTFNDCDIPKGLEVNHIDENKHNNRLDNLNLMTRKENIRWGTGIERSAASRRGRKQTPEHIAKHADALRGKKQSEETIEKRVAKLRGRKLSSETKAKIAAAKRGSKQTPEHIAKVAAANSKPVQALDKDGNVVYEFPSTAEAERQYGFSAGNISRCCNGKLKTYKGYIWRYVDI